MITLDIMMMGDDITLDHISTHLSCSLSELYNKEVSDNYIVCSPYTTINNTCDYYEPKNVSDLLKLQNNSLSMFCLNTQGLRAHWDAFTDLIDKMNNNTSANSFDIIGITELYSMTQNDCSLNGYHPIEYRIRNDTTLSRGGVGMYIKSTFTIT